MPDNNASSVLHIIAIIFIHLSIGLLTNGKYPSAAWNGYCKNKYLLFPTQYYHFYFQNSLKRWMDMGAKIANIKIKTNSTY